MTTATDKTPTKRRDRLKADPEVWAAFYRDGKTLGQIAEQHGCSLYDLSPWLTAPLTHAAYGSGKEWPEPVYAWYAGFSEELFIVGPEETREGAIDAFHRDYGDDRAGYYCQAGKAPLRISHFLPDMETLIEQVNEAFLESDQAGEDDEAAFDLTGAQLLSLQAALCQTCDRWQLENGFLPTGWMFTHTHDRGTIEPVRPEGSDA